MNSLFNPLQRLFEKNWWIEISTDSPRCIYYFGPFKNKPEAAKAKSGYVEDLQQEGAKLLQMSLIRCSTPAQLTVENLDTTL